jgi:hypothetical protein
VCGIREHHGDTREWIRIALNVIHNYSVIAYRDSIILCFFRSVHLPVKANSPSPDPMFSPAGAHTRA